MPGVYVCENCGNDDASKITLSSDGRSFYCAVCRCMNNVPIDPNELRGTIRIDDTELEKALKNAEAQIMLGNYDAVVTQMSQIANRFAYAPEAWYYLARAETRDFTEENDQGKKHLANAKTTFAKDPSKASMQNMISAAERKLGRIPEVKKYRDSIESLEAEIKSLESDSQAMSRQISQDEAYLEEKRKNAAVDICPEIKGKLFLNRFRRLIQAVFAVGLFVLLPWTRDLWNKYLPEQFRITFLPDLAGNIRKALADKVPENITLYLGIGFAVLCVLLLFFALRSKKAAHLKYKKKESAEHRRNAASAAADLEKRIRETRSTLESTKNKIEEKQRLIGEQKQNIDAILSQP